MSSTMAAAADENVFQRLINAAIPIGKYQLHWLELIGVPIGVVSAWFGMKRRVWAWPVGITANIMLFFVYIGATLGAGERIPLSARPGDRSSSSSRASMAGGVGRSCRSAGGGDAPAITPRWMTTRARHRYRRLVARDRRRSPGLRRPVERRPEPLRQPQWWYYWCDAWIFVGPSSPPMRWRGLERVLARVDRRRPGRVPLGFATDYVPTAVMYTFTASSSLYGFSQWVKATNEAKRVPALDVLADAAAR